MPELQISPEKVAWVILRAREFESKVSAFDDGDSETADESDGAILENRKIDPTVQELHGFFDTLTSTRRPISSPSPGSAAAPIRPRNGTRRGTPRWRSGVRARSGISSACRCSPTISKTASRNSASTWRRRRKKSADRLCGKIG
jgi:hypothetical protein